LIAAGKLIHVKPVTIARPDRGNAPGGVSMNTFKLKGQGGGCSGNRVLVAESPDAKDLDRVQQNVHRADLGSLLAGSVTRQTPPHPHAKAITARAAGMTRVGDILINRRV
jgi:hypothetical protein